MTIMPDTFLHTTNTRQPDEVTERLVQLMDDPDVSLRDIVGQIVTGADLHNECGDFEAGDWQAWTDLTALSLAVLIDSDRHQLLLTPLLLAHGGDIKQVDSRGRTLMSFAWQGPVAAYLHDQGAPSAPGAAEAIAAMEETGSVVLVDDEPLISDDELQTLAPEWLSAELEALGFFNPDAARMFPTFRDTHPLIARFSVARMLSDAVYARDDIRIKRLVELGALAVQLGHDYDIQRGATLYSFRDLTFLGLAVVVDGEEGGDDGADGPEGEPRAVPAFVQSVDFLGPHDAHGNTLLHIAKSTRMVEWLLRLGLPLDVTNDKGEAPLDVATPVTRAVMEKWVFEKCLGGDVMGAMAQKRL
ncbi:ankyrin repeat domain-containing protein [Luteibacter aegosomaticola]|uniref:ankyrin repeat domain-containing protein n=1 Tax=Luteibacter aegosomaticola TaxID=2911538 RepID=UPI001FFB26A0|nr:ankyrin repeat domain-containing protein [Luteibacter aegosomaticola]UPG88309.1 ankyrin repeat domain-containing protein [Luteibacter aegosomaticola]